MKKVLSNNITATARQPYLQATHEHYNAAIQECVEALSKAVIADSSKPTILYGCINSNSPNADISAGAIYYNGEVYLCDAFVDASIANAIVGTITTTYAVVDPILFTDGSSHNVHQINKVVWSDAITGTGDFDFSELVTVNKGELITGTISSANWGDESAGTNFYYRKGNFNKLIIDTQIQKLSNPGTGTIINLPAGFRPSKRRDFFATNGAGNPNTILVFSISTGGNITQVGAQGTIGVGTGDYYNIYAEIPLD